MRRAVFSLLAATACVLPFACVQSSDSPQADAGPDASLPDTSPPRDDGSFPDAARPPVDASDAGAPDTAEVDAGPAPITVLVTKGGAPEAGVNVIFHDATGAVVEALTTSALGVATSTRPEDATVSVLLADGAQRKIVTILGVKPGDALTIPDLSPAPAQTVYSAQFEIPTPPPPGSTSYDARAGACLGTGPASPVAVSLFDYCTAAGKFPGLLVARNQLGTALGYAYAKGNALVTDGGAADVTGWSAWSSTFGADGIDVTNAPAGNVDLLYTQIADEVGWTSNTTAQGSDAGTATQTFVAYRGYADAIQPQANVNLQTAGGVAFTGVATRRAAPTADGSIAFDLSKLLPGIDGVTLDASAFPALSVSWTTAGAMTAADGGVVYLGWSNALDGGGSESGEWVLVVPPAVTKVTTPAMPAAASPWLPQSAAGVRPPWLAFVATDAPNAAGYDGFRKAFAGVAPDVEYPSSTQAFPLLPALAAPVTVRASLRGSFAP